MLLFLLGLNSVVEARGSFYTVGKNLSENLAQSTWDNLDMDCVNVDEFLRILGDSNDRARKRIASLGGGSSVEDFGSGYIQGLINVLEVVIEHCTAECSKIGRFAGEQAAFIFCEVSTAAGKTATFKGLEDIPNIGCGEPYSISCESEFYSEAKDMCSYYARGTTFYKYYRASYQGCCSYNPDSSR
ncbi:MAG: hypothetical protein DRR19_16550 [Candidatus Parabeggiatoa sp. nov. 1]|nr:MAG: hypothetical protein DRR19_16550 [Gammaproteobacteria bacterium]